MKAKLKGQQRCGAVMQVGFILSDSIAENIPGTLVVKTSGKINKNLFYSIILPNELTTTYKKELSFKSGMTGQAEIITEDIRLIERFVNPIKAVLKR